MGQALYLFLEKKDLMGQVTWPIMCMKKRLRKNDYFQFSQSGQVETSFGPETGL